MIAQTVIRFNEADGYYEVQHGDKCQRFPGKELALIRARQHGGSVEYIGWADSDLAWAAETEVWLDRLAAERGDSTHYRPANRTRAHLNRIEAVER
jgi:hypothetical protein